MLLIVNYGETNETEFVLEVEDEYRPELIEHIRELENEFYELENEFGELKDQESGTTKYIWIGDYIYEKLNDQDLCAKLHYDFAMWDIVNIG